MDTRSTLVGIIEKLSTEELEALAWDKVETGTLMAMKGAALMLVVLNIPKEDRVQALARFMRETWGSDIEEHAQHFLERMDSHLVRATHPNESAILGADQVIRAALNELMQ